MKRAVLVILDGFGLGKEDESNAIFQAKTPYLDHFFRTYPHTHLQASEEFVGLPKGQMGNSEVGHLAIGSGRILRQGLVEIDHAFEKGDFYHHPAIKALIASNASKRIHLMGLFSNGGVHSHCHHLKKAATYFSENGFTVFLHLFTDGRDTPPKSALDFIKDLPASPNIIPATIQGRYYAMDRDHRWDRTEKAYHALMGGEGESAASFIDAIQKAYAQGITDEFIPPFVIGDYDGMQEGDILFHVNFRADRVRQLLSALIVPDFKDFSQERTVHFSKILGMSSYSQELDLLMEALYPPKVVTDGLVQILSASGKKILKIAETEKYAHVTFFLNGGIEEPVLGEDRVLIPSPRVATYDKTPSMSAMEITEELTKAMASQKYDLIVVNFANPDMVGHTGIRDAIIQAIECIDMCLGRIEAQAIKSDYTLFITADHGNAEQITEPDHSDKPHTAHTCNPVPFIIINEKIKSLSPGSLVDIAPTLLTMYGISPPQTMTGQCLVTFP